MIYGSVCSGIEAASVAWHPLGWRASFLSEIEKFPRAVLSHHYPSVPLHGDFTTIQAGDYESIDLLVGGTPCQSFSIAGLRGGLGDERGNLALEYLRLADRLRALGAIPKGKMMSELVDVISGFSKRLREPHIGAYAEELAREIENAGYTRVGLTQAQREAESAAIIKGFLDCPEIADCAPEDKDGDTHSLESRARRFLQGDAVPKPARRVVQIAIAQGWTIPAEKLSFVPEVIQLCDDGSVWICALDSMKQRRLPPISGGGV